jgi:hypothetical protein
MIVNAAKTRGRRLAAVTYFRKYPDFCLKTEITTIAGQYVSAM